MCDLASQDRGASAGRLQIAVYGKGGIGKSTISANLSAALTGRGQSVLQIGCDPKQDCTRLLLNGKKAVTVMEYLRRTPAAEQRPEQLVLRGYGAVHCIEAGGPEPGVGCAGRGILSMFSLLDRLAVDRERYGAVLYDVLGDVVCGGFAVPLRRDYANAVLLVTSEELMPIHAANNILRGIRNFDGDGARIAGLVVNLRERVADLGAINRFSHEVGLPILATLPRSCVIRQGEQLGKTLIKECYFGQPRIPTTSLDEQDYVLGPGEKLAQIFPAVATRGHALIAIVNSPGAALIGDDLQRFLREAKSPVPAIAIEAPGFSESMASGYQSALISAIEALDPPVHAASSNRVNLLGLSIYHQHWQGSLAGLRELLRLMGIEVVAAPGAGSSAAVPSWRAFSAWARQSPASSCRSRPPAASTSSPRRCWAAMAPCICWREFSMSYTTTWRDLQPGKGARAHPIRHRTLETNK